MKYNLFPLPKKIVENKGVFNKQITYKAENNHAIYKTIQSLFAEKTPAVLSFTIDESIKEEGYKLIVTEESVCICARDMRGHLYGAFTLNQLKKQFNY